MFFRAITYLAINIGILYSSNKRKLVYGHSYSPYYSYWFLVVPFFASPTKLMLSQKRSAYSNMNSFYGSISLDSGKYGWHKKN